MDIKVVFIHNNTVKAYFWPLAKRKLKVILSNILQIAKKKTGYLLVRAKMYIQVWVRIELGSSKAAVKCP